MLIIYTGNGKGKTSATVGQAIRATGQGLKVAFAQFMKQEGIAGEQAILANILKDNFFARGAGFFRNEEQREKHREAALLVLEWAKKKILNVNMLVLDESLYALDAGLITKQELEDILAVAETHKVHLVLSGRNMPEWLEKKASIVTEMFEIKHLHAQGGKATKGIEY